MITPPPSPSQKYSQNIPLYTIAPRDTYSQHERLEHTSGVLLVGRVDNPWCTHCQHKSLKMHSSCETTPSRHPQLEKHREAHRRRDERAHRARRTPLTSARRIGVTDVDSSNWRHSRRLVEFAPLMGGLRIGVTHVDSSNSRHSWVLFELASLTTASRLGATQDGSSNWRNNRKSSAAASIRLNDIANDDSYKCAATQMETLFVSHNHARVVRPRRAGNSSRKYCLTQTFSFPRTRPTRNLMLRETKKFR